MGRRCDAITCAGVLSIGSRRSIVRARVGSLETHMATYIILANFTEQGIRNVKDTANRADAFRAMAQKAGVTVKEQYWTLGAHDIIAIVDAPDDTAVTAVGLSVGALGNVRTQTLRAFSKAEMATIVGKMA
jgi:uncharacterized protein with GYD domain